MALDLGRGEEAVLQLPAVPLVAAGQGILDQRPLRLGRTGLRPVLDQPFLVEVGVAQQQGVVERPAVEIVDPAVVLVWLQQGGVQPDLPFLVDVLAGLGLELQVDHGQHEEQGCRHAGALFRRGAVGQLDPVPHQET